MENTTQEPISICCKKWIKKIEGPPGEPIWYECSFCEEEIMDEELIKICDDYFNN